MQTRVPSRYRRIAQFVLCAAGAASIGAFFAGCTTAPITGRKQFDIIGDSSINQMGLQTYQQALGQAQISKDPKINEEVQRVATRLAAAAEKEFKPGYKWEFNVIDDPKTVNAWCMPGGKIAVYTGILPLTKDDNGLATVLAHEISHALAHHGAERLSRSEIMQVGEAGLLAALGAKQPGAVQAVGAALGIGAQLGVELPFSRTQESEADHIGLVLMAKAGYNPEHALDFWNRMAAYSKGKEPPAFLSDHPSTPDRVATIQKEMPEAMKAYQTAMAAGVGAAPEGTPGSNIPSGSGGDVSPSSGPAKAPPGTPAPDGKPTQPGTQPPAPGQPVPQIHQ